MGSERLRVGEFGVPWLVDRHDPARQDRLTGAQRERERRMVRYQARVSYRDNNGRKKELTGSGDTKGAARRSLDRKMELTRQSMGASSDLNASTTVRSLAERWLAERREKGDARLNTLSRYAVQIEHSIEPTWGDLTLGELTTARLHAGMVRLQRRKSTRVARTVLNQMLTYAVGLGAISTNPMVGIPREETPPKRRKTKSRGPRALTRAEVDAVFACIEKYESPRKRSGPKPSGVLSGIAEVMLGTGCRIGEACALRWRDMHLDHDVPHVFIGGTVVEPCKDGVERLHRQNFTKGDDEQDADPGRLVAIPPTTVATLREHRKRSKFRRLDDPVFANRTGGWLWPGNVRSMLRNAVSRHSDLKEIHPHLFRSTVATLVCEQYGVEVAQEMLGHSNSQTTSRYYVAKRKRIVTGQDAVAAWRSADSGALDPTTGSA